LRRAIFKSIPPRGFCQPRLRDFVSCEWNNIGFPLLVSTSQKFYRYFYGSFEAFRVGYAFPCNVVGSPVVNGCSYNGKS